MNKVIINHPTPNAFVRAAVEGLAETNILYKFYTTLASFPGTILDKMGGFNTLSEIRRRSFNPVLQPYTHILPWWVVGNKLATKWGFNKLIQHEDGIFCVDNVNQKLDKHVASRLKRGAKNGVSGIYAYEDCAIYSFREAKKLGIACLYDLPIGYWRTARKIMEVEAQLHPEWASTLTGLNDSEKKLARKDEELQLADRIFVASSFTASTLQDFPGNLAFIEIIPYSFPPVTDKREYKLSFNKKPLKLLFVGGLSQRKGIASLFKAVEMLGNYVELTVVGRKPVENCTALNTALTKHRWIPSLAHNEILNLMKTQDVLVFPSLFEGFGLVITEAMSQGTPVITTDRTAGPDLIKHGENGWLIEAGSTESLKAAIENLLYQPRLIAEVGNAAMKTAKNRSWHVYSREVSKSVKELIDSKCSK